jgi:hypothetical protein
LAQRFPVLVTLRLRPELPSLRTGREHRTVLTVLSRASERVSFRVVHVSIQVNHLHLIVEAADARALSRGMSGLGVRLAHALNGNWRRCGPVLEYSYHARILRSPREVRNALIYVLNNGRKHGVQGRGVDPGSTGPWFDGWKDLSLRPGPCPLPTARTWLLAIGWRRRGLIAVAESPRRT